MNLAMIIGAVIGYAIGRWPGLIVGALLGYFAGQLLRGSLIVGHVGRVQAQFLESTFAVMGAICKADGRVTQEEIRAAEALFERLHLSAQARAAAQAAFNRGKAPDFDLDAEVARFAQLSRGQRLLHQMFLQIQLTALSADGSVHPAEHDMLVRVARGLGLSAADVERLEAMLRLGARGAGASPQRRVEEAYRVLGVDASASDAEVKTAYRRLMSQHHPDKLAAKGLPESMRALAEEKTREIVGAYELIQQARAPAG
ncbi:MAG: co-chaperone DjlA [Gammaproteobacteria bacterium]